MSTLVTTINPNGINTFQYESLNVFSQSEMTADENTAAMNAYVSLFSQKRTEITKRLNNYLRYTTEKLPIDDKTPVNALSNNNKIKNSYESVIVDGKVGYMFGEPVSINLNKDNYMTESGDINPVYDEHVKMINDYKIMSAWDDTSAEIGKMAAITGVGAKLLWIDEELNVRSKKIDPWECVWIGESIEDIVLAIRQYPIQYITDTGDAKVKQIYEIYDKNFYTKFEYDTDKNTKTVSETIQHFFGIVPLIPFPNNEERISDFEKIKTIIDSYNNCTSYMDDDNENIARTILKIMGIEVDDDIREKLRESGILQMNSIGMDKVDAEFLQKLVQTDFYKLLLDQKNEQIFRISSSIDWYSDKMVGDISGIALKRRMLPMESKCKSTERKINRSIMQEFKGVFNIWKLRNIIINYMDLSIIWTRNLPIDKLEEIQFLTQSKGVISKQSAMGISPLVSNPEKEIAQMENEDTIEEIDIEEEDLEDDNEIENGDDE